jgi:hypothetical protein
MPHGPDVQVQRADQGVVVKAEGVDFTSRLLVVVSGRSVTEIYETSMEPDEVYQAEPHLAGVVESVIVDPGADARRPLGATIGLNPGDRASSLPTGATRTRRSSRHAGDLGLGQVTAAGTGRNVGPNGVSRRSGVPDFWRSRTRAAGLVRCGSRIGGWEPRGPRVGGPPCGAVVVRDHEGPGLGASRRPPPPVSPWVARISSTCTPVGSSTRNSASRSR